MGNIVSRLWKLGCDRHFKIHPEWGPRDQKHPDFFVPNHYQDDLEGDCTKGIFFGIIHWHMRDRTSSRKILLPFLIRKRKNARDEKSSVPFFVPPGNFFHFFYLNR